MCFVWSHGTLRCFVLYWRHCLHTNLYWRRLSIMRRSQWSRGPSPGSAAACLLGLWVRIPPRAWMLISCECCMMSGRGLCVGLITRPKESYRVWCVLSVIMNPRWGGLGPLALLRHGKEKYRALIRLLNCRMWPTHKSSHTVGLLVVFCISYVHACIRVCVCACSFQTQRTYSFK